jgi:hypothetical protein
VSPGAAESMLSTQRTMASHILHRLMDVRAARKGIEESELVGFLSRNDHTDALSSCGFLPSVPETLTVLLRARNS